VLGHLPEKGIDLRMAWPTLEGVKAGKDTFNVTIQDGVTLVGCQCQDGPGGGTAYPRKLTEDL
jgi:hypothetical protein